MTIAVTAVIRNPSRFNFMPLRIPQLVKLSDTPEIMINKAQSILSYTTIHGTVAQ